MLLDILYRLGWAVGIVLLGIGIYRAVSLILLRRAAEQAQKPGMIEPGKPTILYFTTPDCIVCKTTQRPALRRLQDLLGDQLQLIEIDAYDKSELARDWGVLSVPTTFILDDQGHPLHVNYGVTSTDKLLQQLPVMAGKPLPGV